MHPYLERLNGLLGHFSLVVRGLRAVALVFQVAAGLGALLVVLGFLRAGWWWWLGLTVGAVVALPALALWRFRASLVPAMSIPEHVRELPTSVEGVTDELMPMASALQDAVDRPKTPRAFYRSIRSTKSAIDAFNQTSYGKVVGGVVVLHPVALMAGATSTVFAVGSLVFGVIVYLLGGAF